MKITADKEGQEAIKQLIDIALKQGGLQNYNAVGTILNSISLIETSEVVEENVKE